MKAITIITPLAELPTMRRFRLPKRWVFSIAVVFLLCLFPLRESEAKRTLLGQIEKKVGDVRIAQSWKKMQPAKAGQKIYVGDRIKTYSDSRVLLHFQDGADFRLGENTTLRLKRSMLRKEQKRTNVAELLEGALWASVDHQKGQVVFVIESPTAGASIRGTELTAVVRNDVSTFFLKSGELGMIGGDAQFLLEAGEMTANIGNRRLIKPVVVEGRADLQSVQDFIMEATSLEATSTLNIRKEYEEILARFYINYASYLVDVGNYYDAITVLLMAQSMTKKSNIQAETSSLIASIHARFLNAFEEAAHHYQDILANYPNSPHYEVTLFHYGRVLKQSLNTE